MKKVMISIFVILFIGSFYIIKNCYSKTNIVNKDIQVNKNDEFDKHILEEEASPINDDNITNKDNTINSKEEYIKKQDDNKQFEENKNEIKEEIIIQENKNETITQSNESENKQIEQKEPISKNGPWDNLGMTEYQYYNEPMYSYEKVDFSVVKYGSEQATIQACLEYGDNYAPYLNGEVAYHCSTVYTASGKYLGEWFHTEKLSN